MFGVPLAFSDAQLRRLPNSLVACLTGATAAAVLAVAIAAGDAGPAWRAALAAPAVTAAYFSLYALAHGRLGGGDVKLAAPLGAVLGWHSWSLVATGFVLSWTAAALFVVAMKASGKDTQPATFPLGPFLIGGTLAALCVAGR
ncbi:prepilin peptidase [Amycolatopsis sp. H20-H5]|uniref:prepilin peptidase n=1 Tax=Amycolatopsis sp. H20-H5 TaxID=3046309 RepID=UPI002DBC1421|nr:prepilin peptidase [Amycolatopsis sp. H20-H5]MEC3974312.1 prepilin peptidase [Amycolatopsis sp. H20-H5]